MGEARMVLQKSKAKASQNYDKNSKILKRSYMLMQANDQMKVKKLRIIKIQRFMKKVYKKIQEKRADEFQLMF